MADPVKANIIKTKAVMWFAPEGEARPSVNLAAGAAWGGNWARLGFTSAPLSMTYDDKRMSVKVEEILADSIQEWRIEESGMLETELAEVPLDYVQLLTGGTVQTTAAGAGQVGYEELDIGGNARVEEWAFGFEGIRYDENDNALPIRFFVAAATFKLNGKLEWSQKTDSYVKLPIQIKALGDTDNSGRLFKSQRVTAPATS